MKVIEPPNKEKVEIIEFNQANNECRYCPCCGADFYGKHNIDRMEYTITDKHTFYTQTYKVMRYDCNKCGCKYESEPYNYETQPLIKDNFFRETVLTLSVMGYIAFFMIGLFSIIYGSIIPFLAALWVIILISMNLYAHFNDYKKYNKNKFKPYNVYKKIGDK